MEYTSRRTFAVVENGPQSLGACIGKVGHPDEFEVRHLRLDVFADPGHLRHCPVRSAQQVVGMDDDVETTLGQLVFGVVVIGGRNANQGWTPAKPIAQEL